MHFIEKSLEKTMRNSKTLLDGFAPRVLTVWRCLLLNLMLLAPALAASADPLSVGAYTSSERSFNTASYWLEGKDGVVLIDTQFLPSETERFLLAAEKATGKKVVLALVLHSNPDKFNGTASLQQRGIKVVTSQQVKALIPAVHQIRLGWFYREFQPDYPRDTPNPESFGDKTRDFDIAGIKLTAHVLGSGCSGAHVVVQAGSHLFVGDLISHGTHAWLELGLVDEWLARLDQLKTLNSSQIYPGRGAPGGPGLLDQQAGYLARVQSFVAAENPVGELGRFKKWQLKRAITHAFPDYRYPTFMSDGLEVLWKRQAARGKAPEPLN